MIGLVLLYFGAEGLVRGASSLSLRVGIQPLTIGLTVVAFGTSMPELFVSLKSALSHYGSISIGNVVGSNIFNIAVIVGIAALIRPLKVQIQLIRWDTPVMIGVALIFIFFIRDLFINRTEGMILTVMFLLYTSLNGYFAQLESRKKNWTVTNKLVSHPTGSIWLDGMLITGGILILIIGSNLLVINAVKLARALKVSEAVIGLTLVAAGTSLPELATSIIASLRREPEIAIGNIVGSNIFNILCIIGITSLIAPIECSGVSLVDIWIMVGLSGLLFPIMISGMKINRAEGILLVLIYIGYLTWLLSNTA
jgi:cation:H+ antiporter